MNIPLYSQNGEIKGEITLNPRIFEVEVNEDVIHRSLIRQLANARKPIAQTKTRGEVRGGGKKPWKQKGTGRARQGSSRAPHWRGGGVTFGPTSMRNFTKRMPKKERRKALFSLLAGKAKESKIIALEEYKTEKPKTKTFHQLLQKLPFDRNVLVVLAQKNEIIQKSSNNLPYAKSILVSYLNPVDLLNYRTILFLKDAFKKLEDVFLKDER